MSANRGNVVWHLTNLVGGQIPVPQYGSKGFAPGAIAVKTEGTVGLGPYINRGTYASCDFRSMDGMTPVLEGGTEQDIHATSLVQNYEIGTRLSLPDGRVYRYAKSTAAIQTELGCSFSDDELCTYSTTSAIEPVGETTIAITAVTHAAIALNELRGGYVIVYHDGGGGYTQFRRIISNPAADADVAFSIVIDRGLDTATVAATTGIEVWRNPYATIAPSTVVSSSKAGVPAVQVGAASTYFWVQTWGPCWVAPQLASFADANDRAAYWRHDGSIEGEIANASKNAGLNSTQYAGFLINEGLTTGPLLMLQVCP